ncbi:MAG: hypothetical protein D6760_06275, partial [Deltaproteobacteria bacterium]
PAFLEKAPAEVVAQDQARREATVKERDTLQRSLARVVAIGEEV